MPTTAELDQMHKLYRQGGQERQLAPHIVYPEPACSYSTIISPFITIQCPGNEQR
jgi:hypothetical protein